MSEWKSIDAAPEVGVDVLVWDGEIMNVAYYGGDSPWDWYASDDGDGVYPTHWMPLPEPPV